MQILQKVQHNCVAALPCEIYSPLISVQSRRSLLCDFQYIF